MSRLDHARRAGQHRVREGEVADLPAILDAAEGPGTDGDPVAHTKGAAGGQQHARHAVGLQGKQTRFRNVGTSRRKHVQDAPYLRNLGRFLSASTMLLTSLKTAHPATRR